MLLGLSRKGSIELEVKKLLLDAREKADKVVAEAETLVKDKITAAEAQLAEKEEKLTRGEDRLFKRE